MAIRRERHVITEPEIGVMCLQAKECQELPETTRNKEKTRKDSPLEPSERDQHLDFGLLALNCETINFCCFKPPSLWYVVVAVLGN